MHIFAFRHPTSGKTNISSKVVPLIPAQSKHILSDKSSIDRYIMQLLEENPKYILGLGSWSGRDNTAIRIETRCTNKWRNQISGDRLESATIKLFVQITKRTKLTDKMGNSFCNYISWRIVKLIQRGKLTSHYTFLHIPKNMEVSTAATYISEMIKK